VRSRCASPELFTTPERERDHLDFGVALAPWDNQGVRTVLWMIGFALFFWLGTVFVLGFFAFAVGWPQSDEPAPEAVGLVFLIPAVAGAIFGWRRARKQITA
jgi:hypothetical protein